MINDYILDYYITRHLNSKKYIIMKVQDYLMKNFLYIIS